MLKRKTMKKLLAFVLPILFLASCELEDTNEFIDVRDRFVGDWNVQEASSTTGESNYTVTISYDESDDTKVMISNFYNLGSSFSASGTLSTTNEESLTVENQELDGFYIEGSGVMTSDSQLDFNFTADDGVEVDSLQATFIKQ